MHDEFPPNFPLSEMIASDLAIKHGIDNYPDEEALDNLLMVASFLQELREELKAKRGREVVVIVTSGYRCLLLNKIAGGSKTSAHVDGLAADITVPGMSAYELAVFIRDNMFGYDQLILEYGRWVHIGFADNNARGQALTAYRMYHNRKPTTGYHNGIVRA